jgi:alpha-tubulin suppressor-like RCC1 family protein
MGPYHSAVITNNGDLYTFGYGKYGALGNGRENNEWEPARLELNNV